MIKTNNKISAVLVIHNEKKVIERALQSIPKSVDEIIVVHDGPCSDNSLMICKKYNCKIFVRPFVGEAEPHRVFTYQKAKNNWILQIDADEYLSPELQKALPKLVSDTSVSCYEFIWPYWDGKKYQTTNWPYKKALFQKNRITFAAYPHSEVIAEGITKKTNLRLEHKPKYDNFTFQTFKNKHLKWAKIHASYILKGPNALLTYPAKKPVQLPKYYFIVKHPYLYAFPLASYQAIQAIKSGGASSGILGVKSTLLIFFYWLFLAIELGKLKGYLRK